MYQYDTEKLLTEIENSLRNLKFNNKRLVHNPLARNRNECYEDIKEMRLYLHKYSQYLKHMLLKYDYKNRGNRL